MRLLPFLALPAVLAAQPDAAARIDRFGFDSRAKTGVGGYVTVDVYPVVLFRDGAALTDVRGLAFPGGLEAHRRASPEAWTRWRRAGDAIEVEKKSGWKALAFARTYPRLPDDFRLDGAFRSLAGAGTLAVGGTQAVSAWREYAFTADGRVTRAGGAGGQAEAGDASVVTSASAGARRGHYRVDGLVLHITYDDGSAEDRVLITDPADAKGAIWLDGVGYARRKR